MSLPVEIQRLWDSYTADMAYIESAYAVACNTLRDVTLSFDEIALPYNIYTLTARTMRAEARKFYDDASRTANMAYRCGQPYGWYRPMSFRRDWAYWLEWVCAECGRTVTEVTAVVTRR